MRTAARFRIPALLVITALPAPTAALASKPIDEQMVADGNTRFALDLYQKLKGEPGNLFLSPHSISTALAMTMAGARGETEEEMARVLHLALPPERLHPAFAVLLKDLNPGTEERPYELHVANALWAQRDYTFLPAYLEGVRAHYASEARTLNFAAETEAARRTINQWVEQQTRDRIQELLKPGVLDPLTRLVLTNAIYFKGTWSSPFDKERTRDEPFTLIDGARADVPMMNQTASFGYAEQADMQVLEMPYKGRGPQPQKSAAGGPGRLSMVVLLPRRPEGLANLEQRLSAKNLPQWLGSLKRQEVVVALPRFTFTDEFSLAGTLQSMGMSRAFSSEADFSGMDGTRELFIGEVIHKAFVEVNEEGTEAAAATAVGMRVTSLAPQGPPPPVFRADRPFVFIIRDTHTGSILFLGRVMDPREG